MKILSILILVCMVFPAYADDDSSSGDDNQITAVDNKQYLNECGSCHFAYQPSLLPIRSWKKLMLQLADHFGDNAELAAEEQKQLTDYLVANSADLSPDKFAKKLLQGLAKDETPLRITIIPYFVHEHDKIPKKAIGDNPEVKSLSYCNKCHTGAETGNYSENSIKIPGYERLNDDNSSH
ncbi:MAG: diheme cytochrome c [Thiomargarita sp.]|nr:diheme cytochrome c [Thiomargarita sp.]